MAKLKTLAIDLGASSGRGIIGEFDGRKLSLRENHRFQNDPVKINGSLNWDILRIFFEIKNILRTCALSEDRDIKTIGIDTWGLDFGLLGADGRLLENPYNYRDSRTDGINVEAYKRIGKEELYNITGLQYLQFNTIFQLLSLALQRPHILRNAETLLMTPDLLNYFLTGIKKTEYTIASTSSLLNAKTGNWDKSLFAPMDIPEKLFTEIVRPGNILGGLLPEITEDTGELKAQVINAASHDTASAIAAVPAAGENFVYISSGTWSLMGMESREPVITEKSRKYDFTNEGGVGGTIRVLRNVMGLWLIQESRRQWEREGERLSFDEMSDAALKSPPCASLVNVDLPEFLAPGNMPERIRGYCSRTNQPVPETKGALIRCIYDSLALTYKRTLGQINELQGVPAQKIHVVGGGTKETLLCQFTADACGVPVYAGPIEATAIGNVAVQLTALGEIKDPGEARRIIADSFETAEYTPENTNLWDDALVKYEKLLKT